MIKNILLLLQAPVIATKTAKLSKDFHRNIVFESIHESLEAFNLFVELINSFILKALSKRLCFYLKVLRRGHTCLIIKN